MVAKGLFGSLPQVRSIGLPLFCLCDEQPKQKVTGKKKKDGKILENG